MNTIKTFFFLMVLTGILLLVGGLIGGEAGIMIALVLAVAMNFGAYWFSDRIALGMTHAYPVTEQEDPGLYGLVAHQAELAGLPMPNVYEIDSDSPNAFATGRSPKKATVAVTTGIRRVLTREELGAVLAHEMAHVGNRDTLIMAVVATIAGAISMLAMMAQFRRHLWRFRRRPGKGRQHHQFAGGGHRHAHRRFVGADGHIPGKGVSGRRHRRPYLRRPLRVGQRVGEVGKRQRGPADESLRVRVPPFHRKPVERGHYIAALLDPSSHRGTGQASAGDEVQILGGGLRHAAPIHGANGAREPFRPRARCMAAEAG